ncbi:STAS domain-containing protein [Streptomyces sp. RM72]|nr:STAS domain-containing protein [Streptomyces sp. RM72]
MTSRGVARAPAHGPSDPTARRAPGLGCPYDARARPHRPAPLRSEYTVGHTTVLELRGDLDIAVTPIVTARLDALTACPHPDLVVDLRPVPFLDCAALGVLCRARTRIRERHGRLRLVSGSDRLRDIVRRTGLADSFDVYRSLTDALAVQPRVYRRVVPAFDDRPSGGFSWSR